MGSEMCIRDSPTGVDVLVSGALGQERLNTAPDQLISCVTEELFGLRVNPYDRPILSDHDDGISYRLQNGAGIEGTVKAVRTVKGLFLGSLKPGGLRLRSHHRGSGFVQPRNSTTFVDAAPTLEVRGSPSVVNPLVGATTHWIVACFRLALPSALRAAAARRSFRAPGPPLRWDRIGGRNRTGLGHGPRVQ